MNRFYVFYMNGLNFFLFLMAHIEFVVFKALITII
jgi:hypothetical protein